MLLVFVSGLVLSGVTAIPLQWEVDLLKRIVVDDTWGFWNRIPGLADWIAFVHRGLTETYRQYPFMAYGTDWLAFAHIVIAVAFWGPIRDPVKNIWVIEFGMIACALIVPTVLIFGPLRGIPPGWQIIDTSFGIFGIVPLWLARRAVRQIRTQPATAGATSPIAAAGPSQSAPTASPASRL